eukprot:4703585-Alexandrium_andersonii.AAC.1
MSASLVGSEMCIRDRRKTIASVLMRIWLRSLFSSPPRAESCQSRGAARTVSYTHLTLPTICSV